MWRGVLAWGQAKAGVQSSVKQWTENDRSKMKQVLNVSYTVDLSPYLLRRALGLECGRVVGWSPTWGSSFFIFEKAVTWV